MIWGTPISTSIWVLGNHVRHVKDPEAIQHGSFDIQWSITYLKIATRPGFHGYISMFDG